MQCIWNKNGIPTALCVLEHHRVSLLHPVSKVKGKIIPFPKLISLKA
jgi:hypothetical protein